jgi:hypothetical protein
MHVLTGRIAALRSLDVLHAAAKKESAWLRRYGKPRLPFDREYREILGYKKMDPEDHIRALDDHLSVTPYLVPREDWLHKPVSESRLRPDIARLSHETFRYVLISCSSLGATPSRSDTK